MTEFNYQEFEIKTKSEPAPATAWLTLKGRLDFKPGQFVQINLPHFGEATFAPCSDPADKKEFQLLIKGCGSTTAELVKLLPGDKLQIRGPYGNGWPIEQLRGQNILLIAGGLGLVPIRPLIYEILTNSRHYKKISLFVGFKSPDFVLFGSDLQDWQKKISEVKVLTEYTHAGFWGQKGLITDGLERAELNPKKTTVLICGPEIMVENVLPILAKKGFADDQIYISYERRMECGIGVCQHCNIGKYLVCADGPVFRYDQIKGEIGK